MAGNATCHTPRANLAAALGLQLPLHALRRQPRFEKTTASDEALPEWMARLVKQAQAIIRAMVSARVQTQNRFALPNNINRQCHLLPNDQRKHCLHEKAATRSRPASEKASSKKTKWSSSMLFSTAETPNLNSRNLGLSGPAPLPFLLPFYFSRLRRLHYFFSPRRRKKLKEIPQVLF